MILSFDLLLKLTVSTIMGYVVFRLKQIEKKAEASMDRESVKELIEDKLAPIQVLQKEWSEDIKRIESKLDRLIEKK